MKARTTECERKSGKGGNIIMMRIFSIFSKRKKKKEET
jgi:hypothetical protein